jgi:hypothetical protein
MKKPILFASVMFAAFLMLGCANNEGSDDEVHSNIKASTFWLNEEASKYNNWITNTETSWSDLDGRFTVNGQNVEDNPRSVAQRDNNFILVGYDGKENPYYFALPYDDCSNSVFDGPKSLYNTVVNLDPSSYERKVEYGEEIVITNAYDKKKKNNSKNIPWYDEKSSWSSNESVVKGRWIKVKCVEQGKGNGQWVYAQWLDAGPYHYDDFGYVFGTSRPRNEGSTGVEPKAGIDLSPAVMLKIGIPANDLNTDWGGTNTVVEWQFVKESDVPHGPWKIVVSDNKCRW